MGWCPVWVAPWGPDYVEGLVSEVPALGCLGILSSPENPFLSTAASWSLLSLRFWPCSFLLAWQLLSSFKEVVSQKKAKAFGPGCPVLVCAAPASHPAVWKTLPLSLGVEVLPCPLVPCALIKHCCCFGVEMPFLPFINQTSDDTQVITPHKIVPQFQWFWKPGQWLAPGVRGN